MKFLTPTIILSTLLSIGSLKSQTSLSILEIDSIENERILEVEKLRSEIANLTLNLIKVRLDISGEEEEGRSFKLAKEEGSLHSKEDQLMSHLESSKHWLETLIAAKHLPPDQKKGLIEECRNAHFTPKPIQQREKIYSNYSSLNDVAVNPPKSECVLDFDGIDSISNKRKKVTAQVLLFSHTDSSISEHFKDRDFMRSFGRLASFEGGVKLLYINIAVASSNAPAIFGKYERNSVLTFRLIDGSEVSLLNSGTNEGYWLPAMQSYLYNSIYKIGAKDEQELSSTEIESVIIRWSKSQDEFKIYEMDFLINQFNCLQKE